MLRFEQAARMMNPFGVARDLGADDAVGIGVPARAAHPADGALVEHLDLERAGGGAIVRAGGVAGPGDQGKLANRLIHRRSFPTLPHESYDSAVVRRERRHHTADASTAREPASEKLNSTGFTLT